VAFPAAATILTSTTGYGLSRNQYGLLFLPQVIMAIAASVSLPELSRRVGLKRVLAAGLAADIAAMTLLVASAAVRTEATAYPMLLVATAFLGLGFGLTLGSISTYAGAFHPDRREVALTSLNVMLGLGTALSPLLVAVFVDVGRWWYLPLLAAAGLIVILVASALQPLVVETSGSGRSRRPPVPPLFWLFAVALVFYGVAETMFGNWGTTLLVNGGASMTAANYALATFWAAVTIGRLAIAMCSRVVPSTAIYVALPVAIAATLLVAPLAGTATGGIVLFGVGGLACSGFFPMTIGYGESTFPNLVELAAGWLIAAYQVGYGLAAFGGGALQNAIPLSTVFRVAAILAIGMGALALPIAAQQHRARPEAVAMATPG
jgi:MFS family permease